MKMKYGRSKPLIVELVTQYNLLGFAVNKKKIVFIHDIHRGSLHKLFTKISEKHQCLQPGWLW